MGGLAQLVLGGPAVLTVEAVAGDQAADAAHGDAGSGTGRAERGTWRGCGSPGSAKRLRS